MQWDLFIQSILDFAMLRSHLFAQIQPNLATSARFAILSIYCNSNSCLTNCYTPSHNFIADGLIPVIILKIGRVKLDYEGRNFRLGQSKFYKEYTEPQSSYSIFAIFFYYNFFVPSSCPVFNGCLRRRV